MGNANINATVTPLVPAGAGSPLQVASASNLRSSKILGAGLGSQLATDLDNITGQINSIITLGKVPPTITQFVLTNAAGQVIAAVGPVTYQGVPYVNYFSEIHAGNPLGTRNPAQALFNANTDGSVTIGQHGWLDVHDPYGGNAAWIGTRKDTLAVTGAANNGSGLIRLLVVGHNFVTGNVAQVRNTQYYGVLNALGTWALTVVDASHVDLQGSVWAGVFAAPVPLPGGVDTYSPTIDRVLQVTSAVSAGGLIKLGTAVAHGYSTGDEVSVGNIGGVPAATGQWIIKVVDATHFTLNGSVFSGGFASNGQCLRYFAGMLAQTIAIGNSFTDFNLRAFADGTLEIKNASFIIISPNGEIIIDPTGPVIEVFDAASNLVVWMGVHSGFTGLWGENVWIGGTGPTDAVISATAGGVFIDGASIILTLNGVETVISNPATTVFGTATAASLQSFDVATGSYAQVDAFDIGLAVPIVSGGTPNPVIWMSSVAGSGLLLVTETSTIHGAHGVTIDGGALTVTASATVAAVTNVTTLGTAGVTVHRSGGGGATVTITFSNVDSPGFSVAGVPGINDTLTYVTGVTPTTSSFGTSLTVGTGSFGISLTVNTDATGVAGTPSAGQSNITVVTGVTLNLGTAVSSVSLNTAAALTAATPVTTSNTWSKGILTS